MLPFIRTKDKSTNEKRYKSNEICHDEKSNLNNHKQTDEMDKLELRTPNQKSHKQIAERETSEYIQLSQSREEHLHRTRQLKNKLNHCVKSNYSKYDEESDIDDTEEVIYSEGEPFEGYQYPNNTWDSDDSLYEEDYSSKTGWI